jgi:O-6-methylguanine DNA methyltransferase
METVLKYTIFKTKWGYFGLAGTEYALYRTCLPGLSPEKLKSLLLKGLSLTNRASPLGDALRRNIEFEKTFFKELQQQIIAYFEGAYVNFSPDIPLMLDGISPFYKSVLTTCKFVKFGQTINYGELAKKAGRPAAARAVGNALAKNPLPLIIPCHRVIRSDGSLGGFSGLGGLSLKRKLLLHEQNCLSAAL